MKVQFSASFLYAAMVLTAASLAGCSDNLSDEELAAFIGPQLGTVYVYTIKRNNSPGEVREYHEGIASDGPRHVRFRYTQSRKGEPQWHPPGAYETEQWVENGKLIEKFVGNGNPVLRGRPANILLTGPLEAGAKTWTSRFNQGSECTVTAVGSRSVLGVTRNAVEVTCEYPFTGIGVGGIWREVSTYAEGVGMVERAKGHVTPGNTESQRTDQFDHYVLVNIR